MITNNNIVTFTTKYSDPFPAKTLLKKVEAMVDAFLHYPEPLSVVWQGMVHAENLDHKIFFRSWVANSTNDLLNQLWTESLDGKLSILDIDVLGYSNKPSKFRNTCVVVFHFVREPYFDDLFGDFIRVGDQRLFDLLEKLVKSEGR